MDVNIIMRGDKELFRTMKRLEGFFKSKSLLTVLEDAKNSLIREAQKNVPIKSRILHRSINGKVIGFGTQDVRVRVGSSTVYAPYVEGGTRPHEIRPRRKKLLQWVKYDSPETREELKGAAAVFTMAKKVNHPGTKPQPFMRPAFETVKPRFIAALQRIVKEALRGGVK